MLTGTQVKNQQLAADHRFFTIMTVAALVVVFAGFATSYYLWPITRATHLANGVPIAPSFPLIVHVHAAAFSGWILLLVAQVRLVAVGRTALHRQVGVAAAWLLPFLVATGLMTTVRGARGPSAGRHHSNASRGGAASRHVHALQRTCAPASRARFPPGLENSMA